MIKWIKRLFGLSSLDGVLTDERVVRFRGVRFRIRKINALNYLDGSKVMVQYYDTYKTALQKNQEPPKAPERKMMEHLAEVLVAGVVSPKLSHKDDGTGVHVEKLFVDWDLVNGLYGEIMAHTYGKKKLNL